MRNKSLLNFFILTFSVLPFSFLVFAPQAQALPGEAVEKVSTWIKAHPTLQPRSGERLFVKKSDTAAQRFSFLSSVLAPGKVGVPTNRSKIRSERITMYDAINGMSFQRLKESLRVIYGLDIYQDYNGSDKVYEYPNQSAINSARFAKTPIREALQGELRLGDRFAYWIEVAQPKNGKAYFGKITVLLRSDLEKLKTELQSR